MTDQTTTTIAANAMRIGALNKALEAAVYSKPSPPSVVEIAAELHWTADEVRRVASQHYWMWVTDDDRIDYDGE